MDAPTLCNICMKHTSSINNPAPVLRSDKNSCDDCNVYIVNIRILLTKLGMDWTHVKVLTYRRAVEEHMVPDTRKNNGKLW